MVREKRPEPSAADDFANLLLSFNSSNKIQLNVINIISETMCSRAEEIACLITNMYEQNAELGTVIDQLSVRNSVYKSLFEKHARQREQRRSVENSCTQEKTSTYSRGVDSNDVDKTMVVKASCTEPVSVDAGGNTLTSSSNKQLIEPKDLRHKTVGAVESGAKKKSIGSAQKVCGLGRADGRRHHRVPSSAGHERNVKDTAAAGQIRGARPLSERWETIDGESSRKKTKTAHSLLCELELLVVRGLELEDSAKTINTQLLDETLFKTIQCKICGLRYSADEKETLSQHLADHQRRIRASESKAVVSRDYMCRKSEWLISKLNLPSVRVERKAITCSKPQTCKICKNRICLNWCDDTEQWILEDAVEIGRSQYCHRKCVE